MKNSWGGTITKARFPMCRKCLAAHAGKKHVKGYKTRGFRQAIVMKQSALEKSLDLTFRRK
jgi:hypothetical protein